MLPFAGILLTVCFLMAFVLQKTSCCPRETAWKRCYLPEWGARLCKQCVWVPKLFHNIFICELLLLSITQDVSAVTVQ